MCGIAGMLTADRTIPQESLLRRMCEVQLSRGPDDEGVFMAPGVGLAHRRLAVIDLTGGAQPMVRHAAGGEAVALTYAGELFNYRELRRELEQAGVTFTTSSDTEVVLASYMTWGGQCVEKFVGMFAFAVWDGAVDRLLLVRDRLGVKPLHWCWAGGDLVFASEIKALLCHPLVTARIDDEGVSALFSMFGVHRPGRTPLAGIHEVAPGTMILADGDGVRAQEWWRLEARGHEEGAKETRERVRELLAQSVRSQLGTDVPLCSLLSGGVDSSAIAALAAPICAVHGQGLITCTVDFDGLQEHFRPDADRPSRDAPYVDHVVNALGTTHRSVCASTPDLWAGQQRATLARDLPSMGDLDASLLSLFGEVGKQFTVALSGESADELFGGYAWFHDAAAVGRHGFPWMLDDLGLGNVLRPDVLRRLRPEERVRAEYDAALARVPGWEEPTEERRRREVSHIALTRFLPVLLDRKDRTSMAHSVEVRVPFCDHRLVEYVWNIPWDQAHRAGQVKGVLRDAVRDLLPAAVVDRPKAMFPAVEDPGYDRLLQQGIEQLLQRSRILPLVDHGRVRDLAAGRSPRPAWQQRMALAYLLQMDFWMQHYDVAVEV